MKSIFLRSTPSPLSSSIAYKLRPFSSEIERNVKVTVWWDMENCSIPSGVDAVKIAQNITTALRVNGIKGPVTITGFGDFMNLSRSEQETLSMTGVSLKHVPSGAKNTIDKSLLADLVFWVSQNPPPAHLFLISGDKDFANILHRLRMNNYNILLANKDNSPGVLGSAASIMWHWYKLARGDSFSGKHFNDPPDGPSDSWYGYIRAPVEDPFLDGEQNACAQVVTPDTGSSSKSCTVPVAVVNQIREVVNSYPKGINLLDLPSELAVNNVPMDENLFGFRNFTLLLRSLPTVLKLEKSGDGRIVVHGIGPKVSEPVKRVKVPEPLVKGKVSGSLDQRKVAETVDQPKVAKTLGQSKLAKAVDQPKVAGPLDEDRRRNVSAELTGSKSSHTLDAAEKSSLAANLTPKIDPPIAVKQNIDSAEGQSNPLTQNNPIIEEGFFERMQRFAFGPNDASSDKTDNNNPAIRSTTTDSLEKVDVDGKSASISAVSSNSNESNSEEKATINSEKEGMFRKLVRFWKGSTQPYNTLEQLSEDVNQVNSSISSSEIFSKAAFWEDMLSFLQSYKGAALISQSKTREQIAQQLQKGGPKVLHTLTVGDLNRLVDLLISEKKWVVEENTSNTFPFKLLPVSKNPVSDSSNPLSSIFSGKPSQSHLQVALPKTKSEVLRDCQRLVADILKESPQGFNLPSFRKWFRERYGYGIANKKFGYEKLGDMLETIPGIVYDCNRMVPSSKKIITPYNVENNTTGRVNNLISEILSDGAGKKPTTVPELLSGGAGKSTDVEVEEELLDGYSDLDSEKDGKSATNNSGDGSTSSLLLVLDSFYGKNDDRQQGPGK
ncbi:hypothetical protein ACHQM5_016824 [Ranunculus cassubicifolius]